jgi:hypothetical protein
VAQALNTYARRPNHAALPELLAAAQALGAIGAAEPAAMARQFLALLWEDLRNELLLRIADRPGAKEIEQRARDATEKLQKLYPVS